MNGFAARRAGALIVGAAIVLGAGLLAQNAFAAYDAYLKIEGISGDSKSSDHQGWIEIQSFQWGAPQSARDMSTGMASGKRQHSPLIIRKLLDSASPQLMRAVTTGKHFNQILIEERGANGKVMRITLEDAFISSVHTSDGGDRPMETIEIQYAKSSTSMSGPPMQNMDSMRAMQRPQTQPPH
jgi:type VI secretion system secreted protein Hcp